MGFLINPYRFGGSSIYPYSVAILNPGAESGSVSDWTQDLSSTFTVASGVLDTTNIDAVTGPYAGTYCYYHGSTGAGGVVHQDIAVSSLHATVQTDIAAGKCRMEIGAYCITDVDGNDWAQLNVHFYNSSGDWISGTKHDTSNPSSWSLISHSAIIIPESTATIRLELRGYRASTDARCNVYWDSLYMTITKRSGSGKHATVFSSKPTATTGWTNVVSTCTYTATVSTNSSGGQDWGFDPAIRWGNVSTGHCYYAASLPSGFNTDIDAGICSLKTFYRHQDDPNGGCTGRTYVEFYDSGGTIIGSRTYSEASEQQYTRLGTGGWHEVTYSVPANARSIRFGHMGTKTSLTVLYHQLQYASGFIYK